MSCMFVLYVVPSACAFECVRADILQSVHVYRRVAVRVCVRVLCRGMWLEHDIV